MVIISPAQLDNAETLEYRVKGQVLRVFDTNGFGDLLPVEYTLLNGGSKFKLKNYPHGKIYAEVVRARHQ